MAAIPMSETQAIHMTDEWLALRELWDEVAVADQAAAFAHFQLGSDYLLNRGRTDIISAYRGAFPLTISDVQASLDFDFQNGRYYQEEQGDDPLALIATTRASVAYADNLAGIWSPFLANVPRITDKGLLIEGERTNVVLWNRDLTNAAWIKSNATAAQTQTGIDGVANSASLLTSTAANGTALQAITLASSARFHTAFVKRITGTGVVQLTMDNGTTWTTAVVTLDWTRVAIPAQTLANPTVGFRLVTNGDAIAVDFVQNTAGTFATSPILVTTVAVARAADAATLAVPMVFDTAYTLFGKGTPHSPVTFETTQFLVQIDNSAATNRLRAQRVATTGLAQGVSTSSNISTIMDTTVAWEQNISGRVAVSAINGEQSTVFNGGVIVTGSGNLPVGVTSLQFGKASSTTGLWNGRIERVILWRTNRIPDANLPLIGAS